MKAKRILWIVLVLLLVMVLNVPTVLAGSARFVNVSGSVDSTGVLYVIFNESGLKKNTLYNYTISGSEVAEYACVDNNGVATHNENVGGSFSQSQGFGYSKGKLLSATLGRAPFLPTLNNCPDPGVELACVYYSGVTLTNTTNGDTKLLGDYSRVFYPDGCVLP